MRQRQFLKVVDRDEAARRWDEALGPPRDLGSCRLPIDDALGRVMAADLSSEVDVPGFDRANMDGWALLARDTFGASEAEPRRLRRHAQAVRIGALASQALAAGEAMAIPTGGALPRGADAVLPVEASDLEGDEVVIRRALTPGSAVTWTGTDIARGEIVIRAGSRITSREIGVLAALGLADVLVRQRPRVAVLSTGDELVAPGARRAPGQVHDANASLVAAAVRENGGEPVQLGIVADEPEALRQAIEAALADHDMLILSGGTSKGPGDQSAMVLADALEPPGVVVHGVALKPGKPLCLAASGDKPVVVLPGFPTSAIFTFQQLVAPRLRAWAGWGSEPTASLRATLPFRMRSDPGRRELCLVHLVQDEHGERLAYPIGKGSGSITTWSQADGFFVMPVHCEQVEAGASVEVQAMAGSSPHQDDLVIIGSHCVGLDVILAALRERGFSAKVVAAGSEAGLTAVKRGACDIAPMHLFDPKTGGYNRPFLDAGTSLVEGYGRMQAVVFRPDDARFLGRDARQAFVAAARDGASMINRNRGSGTRALIDDLLGDLRPPGHSVEASSHVAVAAAIAQGRADFGVAIDVAAEGLGTLPLSEERFDFAVPAGRMQRPAVAAFAEVVADDEVRRALRKRGLRA
jgi:molybdopterin molybdotransferase/putative molybdopterin biosynthesis protein